MARKVDATLVRYIIIGATTRLHDIGHDAHMMYKTQAEAEELRDGMNNLHGRTTRHRRDEHGNMVEVDDPDRPYEVVKITINAEILKG